MLESVDFPAPFSPSSACTSPSAGSESTPSFAMTPGNRFTIPCSATAAGTGSASQTGRRAGSDPARRGPRPLALRAPEDTLDEPVHGIELANRGALALGDP